MTELERLLYRELYKKSFYDFVRDFWNTADPSTFVDGQLIKIYCEIFQYMCKEWVGYKEIDIKLPEKTEDIEIIDVRQNKHNLCLMVPPRHTKSMIFNVFGPVWLWISYPIKAVSISHTQGLAGQMNAKRHAIINSDKFKFFFSDIHLIANSTSFLKDNRGGELYSQNRNAFTGYGGDVIINDDLTNAETARKDQAEMLNAWAYYQNTMPSRINDINKCIIMNIQQRLAPNDIAGHIMNDENLANTYVFVTLPAIFKKKTYVVCPISGDVVCYNVGDCLWPERFGDYSSLKFQVGETIFETQYLQNPIASNKTIIKPHMIVERDENEVPSIDYADMIYASHDFPVKDKDTSDFLGSTLGYRIGSTLYIIDSLEKHLAFVKSVEYVTLLDELYPGIIQIIEDKANGSPILQQLQETIPGLQAYQPGTASKIQRLESASLYMNSGNVVFVRDQFNKMTQQYELSKPLKNLKERLLNFPFVEHDDIIDSCSQLILFVFMDRRYMVYGRAFDDRNILTSEVKVDYSNIFFNKEGDIWKVLEIGVKYSSESKLIVMREARFTASIEQGLKKLKEFAPNKSLFIDCSNVDGLRGLSIPGSYIERYECQDFDRSVSQLNLAFGHKNILINYNCSWTQTDIENFKFVKSKDESMKYVSTKDGYVACLRIAMQYYGAIS